MELWFTMEKQWYYGKIYDTLPKTMELWFIIEKYYGNIPKLLKFCEQI